MSIFTIRSLHKKCTWFSITSNNIEKDVNCEFGLKVSYWKIYRAKEAAKQKIDGTYEETQWKLTKYCEDLKVANPGSIIILCKTNNKFQYLFLYYEVSTTSFESCRALIDLDRNILN